MYPDASSVVSIHAPARGATRVLRDIAVNAQAVSIHAPARGATLTDSSARNDAKVSIHAPARGATVTHNGQGYERLQIRVIEDAVEYGTVFAKKGLVRWVNEASCRRKC